MATGQKIGSAFIDVEARLDRMDRDLRQARLEITRFGNSAERGFDTARRSADRLERSVGGLGRGFRQLVTLVASGLLIRESGRLADEWTNLTNQLRQYEDVLGPVDASSRRFIRTAMDARAPVDGLSQIMQASARAARDLGRSGDDVFNFMDGVSRGAAIANTGVAAVDGAMTQLGQAITSPRVQLQEFQSVIEGTPRLAQAFADGIDGANGSVARLRDMIASGEVTGSMLFEALLGQLPTLRQEFDRTEMTIGQGLQNLRTAALSVVGGMDGATGASSTFATAINDLADTIVNNRDELAEFASALAGIVGIVVRGAAEFARFAGSVRDFLSTSDAEAGDRLGSLAGRLFSGDENLRSRASIRTALRAAYGDAEQADRVFAMIQDFERRPHSEFFTDESLQQIAAIIDDLGRARETVADLRAETTDAVDINVRVNTEVSGSGSSPSGQSAADAINAEADKAKREAAEAYEASYADLMDFLETAEQAVLDARENSDRLAERELETQLAIAQARGDPRLIETLERELAIRRGIADLMALGLDGDKAAALAAQEFDALSSAQDQGEFREGFRRAFSDGVLAALQGDEETLARWFRDAATDGLRGALDNLADMLFDLFSQAMNQGGGKGGGGFLSGIGGFLGSIFGGGKASGGNVSAGMLYKTNEITGEWFAPHTDGRILTISDMQGMAFRGGRGSSDGRLRIVIEEGPMFAARVRAEAEGVAAPMVERRVAASEAVMPAKMQSMLPAALLQARRDGLA